MELETLINWTTRIKPSSSRPSTPYPGETIETMQSRVITWQREQMMNMVSRLSAAMMELRAGRNVAETYYKEPELPSSLVAEVGVARAKELIAQRNLGMSSEPQGVPAELSRLIIDILHFCYAENIDLQASLVENLTFQETRNPAPADDYEITSESPEDTE